MAPLGLTRPTLVMQSQWQSTSRRRVLAVTMTTGSGMLLLPLVLLCLLLLLASLAPHTAVEASTIGPLYLQDRAALSTIWNELGGPQGKWGSADGWGDFSRDHCDGWTGVECAPDPVLAANSSADPSRRVARLILGGNGLTGQIPSALGDLTGLTLLDMALNKLVGPLPPSIANLRALRYLYLFGNELSGELPPLAPMVALEVCFLQHNRWSGALHVHTLLPPRLRMLSVASSRIEALRCDGAMESAARGGNNATGLPFVPSSALQLSIAHNSVDIHVGELMLCLSQLAPNLTWLDASSNRVRWSGDGWDGDEMRLLRLVSSSGWLPFLLKVELANNLIAGPAADLIQILFWTGQMLHLDVQNNALNGSIAQTNSGWITLLLAGNQIRSGFLPPPARTATDGSGSVAADAESSEEPEALWPSFVGLHPTELSRFDSLHLLCPLLVGVGLRLTLDASYTHYQHCRCYPGFARSPSEPERCEPCPEHVSCDPRLFRPRHRVSQGYFPHPLPVSSYRARPDLLLRAVLTPCLVAQVCNPDGTGLNSSSSSTSTSVVPASEAAASAQELAVFQCAPGHDVDSFLCSRCSRGHFAWRHQCHHCDPAAQWLVPSALALGAALLVAAMTYKLAREERTERREAAAAAAAAFAAASRPGRGQALLSVAPSSAAARASASSILPILLFWLQAQSVLQTSITASDNRDNALSAQAAQENAARGDGASADGGGASFDSSLARLSLLGTVLLLQPTALECVSSDFDWRAQFWALISSPLWVALIVALMYGAFRLLDRRAWEEARAAQQERQSQPRLSLAAGAGAGAGGKAATPALLRASSTLAQLHPTEPAPPFLWTPVCVRLLLSLWSLLYMSVASATFSSWSCTSVPQGPGLPPRRFQSAAPAYSCDTPEFRGRLAAGSVVFALFGLGWPTLTFLLSRFLMRQRLQSRQTRSRASMGMGLGLGARVGGAAAAGATGAGAGALLAPLRSSATRLDRALYFISSHILSPQTVSLLVSSSTSHLSPSWFAWQLVLPGRKLLLTGLVALVPRDSSVLPITVLLLLLALALAQAWVRPYAIPSDNLVESLLLLHLSAMFLVAILLSSGQSIDLQLQQQALQNAQQAGLLSGAPAAAAAASTGTASFLVTETLTAISVALELIGVVLLIAVLLHYAWLYRSWVRDDEKLRAWMEKKAGEQDGEEDEEEEEEASSRGSSRRSGSVSTDSTQSASRRATGGAAAGGGGGGGGGALRKTLPAPKLLGARAKGKGGAAPPQASAARAVVGQNKVATVHGPTIAAAPSPTPTEMPVVSPTDASSSSSSRPFSPSASTAPFGSSAKPDTTKANGTAAHATSPGSSPRGDATKMESGGDVELATIGVRLEPVQDDTPASPTRDGAPESRAPLSQILLSHDSGAGAGGREGNLRLHFPGASSTSARAASASPSSPSLSPSPGASPVPAGASEGPFPAAPTSPALQSPSARHASLAAARRVESAASFVSRLHSELQAARSRSAAARSPSAASAVPRIVAADTATVAADAPSTAAAASASASVSRPASNADAAFTPSARVRL